MFQYAFAYFCLKLVNYSFFFWLPYYLHGSFGWSESTADKISIWYDIGGIIGKQNVNAYYPGVRFTFFFVDHIIVAELDIIILVVQFN